MLLRKHNEKACDNREDCFLFVKDLILFWKVILLITALECNSQTMQERVPCHAAGDFVAHTLPLLPSAAARPLRREQVL
jgi:hypothetical protein